MTLDLLSNCILSKHFFSLINFRVTRVVSDMLKLKSAEFNKSELLFFKVIHWGVSISNSIDQLKLFESIKLGSITVELVHLSMFIIGKSDAKEGGSTSNKYSCIKTKIKKLYFYY